jgi:hypothetical protein
VGGVVVLGQEGGEGEGRMRWWSWWIFLRDGWVVVSHHSPPRRDARTLICARASCAHLLVVDACPSADRIDVLMAAEYAVVGLR